MSLKDIWKNKTDGVDDVLAEDINAIAEQTIKNEEFIKNKAETNENKASEITDEPTNEKEYPTTEAVKKYLKEKIKQPDYNQNDDKQADYIKNRPFYTHWEDVNINCSFQFDLDEDYRSVLVSSPDRIGLFEGNSYTVTFKYKTNDGKVLFQKEYTAIADETKYGVTLDINDSGLDDNSNGYLNHFILTDKTNLPNPEEPRVLGNFYYEDEDFNKVEITITGKGKIATIHFLDPKYIGNEAIDGRHISDGAYAKIRTYILEDEFLRFNRIFLKSPNGNIFKLTVDDDGTLSTEFIFNVEV